ncbi:putative tRNA pseudouridine synthase [Trichinella spiralis]|uniref:tRNA pseudouridine synthase n=1 Tax=Trichinella spiralis TaxID=6334 RepID=A0ABR3KZT7_TRISP
MVQLRDHCPYGMHRSGKVERITHPRGISVERTERVDLVKADLGNEPIRLRQAENVTVLNDDWSVSTYKVATLRKRRRAAP